MAAVSNSKFHSRPWITFTHTYTADLVHGTYMYIHWNVHVYMSLLNGMHTQDPLRIAVTIPKGYSWSLSRDVPFLSAKVCLKGWVLGRITRLFNDGSNWKPLPEATTLNCFTVGQALCELKNSQETQYNP